MTNITQAAYALHNYLKISKIHCPVSDRIYCPSGYIDREDLQGNILPGDWRTQGIKLSSIIQAGSNMYSKSAAEIRDSMMSYFNSSIRAVPWQNDYTNST